MVTILNSPLRLCHFSYAWKIAKVILFCKPDKLIIFPENYRITYLLSTVSTLFERLLLSRLQLLLEDFKRHKQFGFWKGHSTTRQLVTVVNYIVYQWNNSRCSVLKAFEKGWYEGLLFKVQHHLLTWLSVGGGMWLPICEYRQLERIGSMCSYSKSTSSGNRRQVPVKFLSTHNLPARSPTDNWLQKYVFITKLFFFLVWNWCHLTHFQDVVY